MITVSDFTKRNLLWTLLVGIVSFSYLLSAFADDRAPAIPLIVHDPYFSVWSMNDKLTDTPTRHWTGADQPMRGLARIDGKAYRFMGSSPREVPAMEQKSVDVRPTHVIYIFEEGGVQCTMTFLTPAIPQDMDLLSRPVTYLTWQVAAMDGKHHAVQLYLDIDARIAVDTADQPVVWGQSRIQGMRVLNVGSSDQHVLARADDNLRADWGYFHLVIPDASASVAISNTALDSFIRTGDLPASDDMDMPLSPRQKPAQLAVMYPFDVSGTQKISKHLLLSFTQAYSIEYLDRKLRPYWARNGKTVPQMLEEADSEYDAIESRTEKFDHDLYSALLNAGGKDYARLAILAFQQTLGANGLAADMDGRPLQFPKENFSGGFISTVDVLYPASPFFLFFNPDLLEAQLKPVMEYASLPRWKRPYAPHDLGIYPLANGPLYGGGERTEENQMPVEESGDMLIMIDAMGHAQGNNHFAEAYWLLLTKWAEYLRVKGLDPENQLSTDDFAGHLAHNANLSIKAIDALGAYSDMARSLGHTEVALEYAALARQMAEKWETMAREGDHYKLAFDASSTWSQKYNLVWDELLGLNLFPEKVRTTELAFYKTKLNKYGLPLDSRRDYTKLDWEIWTATLANSQSEFELFTVPITRWLDETPSRVPLTDWYDTVTGKQEAFQARSVVGGIYIKALKDAELAKRWRTRPQ
jgi:Domain of unknown function (DUF4965)/Domain of unknown function (DUF1793)/Domain of unknown function (DUF5127)/Domain of unknown function (DUF4964)